MALALIGTMLRTSDVLRRTRPVLESKNLVLGNTEPVLNGVEEFAFTEVDVPCGEEAREHSPMDILVSGVIQILPRDIEH